MVFEEPLQRLYKLYLSKISIIMIFLISLVLFSNLLYNCSIYAEEMKLLNYSIKHHGIETKIQYPSTWEVHKNDELDKKEFSQYTYDDTYLINFYAPNDYANLQLFIGEKNSPYLTLSDVISNDIQKLKIEKDISMIELKPTKISHNSAYEITYLEPFSKVLVTKTVRDNIEYSIQYKAGYPFDYNNYYPLIQRIINSLEIGSLNNISYNNPLYGIKVEQYPSNWERGDYYDGLIRFLLPQSNYTHPVLDIYIQPLKDQNQSLKELAEEKRKNINVRKNMHEKILEYYNTTLFNLPAIKMSHKSCYDEEIVDNTDPNSETFCEQFEIIEQVWSIANGISYGVYYIANENDYNHYLSTVKKVMNDLKLIPSNSSISNFIDMASPKELSFYFNSLNSDELQRVLKIFFKEKTNEIKEKLDTKGRWEFSNKLEEMYNSKHPGSDFAKIISGG